MIWTSTADFLAMGGYALYVWGSVACCVAAVAGELLLLRQRRQQVLALLRRQQRAQALAATGDAA